MPNNYKSVFDIIGPVMVGPSSSHTAGAVSIGKAAYHIFNDIPTLIEVHYYESFAQTHRGHGTDYAIISGVLNFEPDDLRVPHAIELAQDRGIKIKFIEEAGDSPIDHPNTAIIRLVNGKHEATIAGCSIGGGLIEIRNIQMNGFDIHPHGPLPIILYRGHSEKMEKLKAFINDRSKINSLTQYRSKLDSQPNLFEIDLEARLNQKEILTLSEAFDPVIYL